MVYDWLMVKTAGYGMPFFVSRFIDNEKACRGRHALRFNGRLYGCFLIIINFQKLPCRDAQNFGNQKQSFDGGTIVAIGGFQLGNISVGTVDGFRQLLLGHATELSVIGNFKADFDDIHFIFAISHILSPENYDTLFTKLL